MCSDLGYRLTELIEGKADEIGAGLDIIDLMDGKAQGFTRERVREIVIDLIAGHWVDDVPGYYLTTRGTRIVLAKQQENSHVLTWEDAQNWQLFKQLGIQVMTERDIADLLRLNALFVYAVRSGQLKRFELFNAALYYLITNDMVDAITSLLNLRAFTAMGLNLIGERGRLFIEKMED